MDSEEQDHLASSNSGSGSGGHRKRKLPALSPKSQKIASPRAKNYTSPASAAQENDISAAFANPTIVPRPTAETATSSSSSSLTPAKPTEKKKRREEGSPMNSWEKLLNAEMEFIKQKEKLVQMRREINPIVIEKDYSFIVGEPDLTLNEPSTFSRVRLSELFEDNKDELILVHLAFKEGQAIPTMCALLADGYNAVADHILDRANFALVAKARLESLRDVARERDWRKIKLLSSFGTNFSTDMGLEWPNGKQKPCISVFKKRRDGIYCTYFTQASLYYDVQYSGFAETNLVQNLLSLLPSNDIPWNPRQDYTNSNVSKKNRCLDYWKQHELLRKDPDEMEEEFMDFSSNSNGSSSNSNNTYNVYNRRSVTPSPLSRQFREQARRKSGSTPGYRGQQTPRGTTTPRSTNTRPTGSNNNNNSNANANANAAANNPQMSYNNLDTPYHNGTMNVGPIRR